MTVTIEMADPRQEDGSLLVGALDAFLNGYCGAQLNHGVAVERLAMPDTIFFLARLHGRAVGCAALQVEPDGSGEVKRMYVDPNARGRGLGAMLLARVEAAARDKGVHLLRLETHKLLAQAISLYRSHGFTVCAAFGVYVKEPVNLYFEKPLL